MINIKDLNEINKILLFYSDKYTVYKDNTVYISDDVKAFLNKDYALKRGFVITEEDAKVLKKMKENTFEENEEGRIIIYGATTKKVDAKSYEEFKVEINLVEEESHTYKYEDPFKVEFFNKLWKDVIHRTEFTIQESEIPMYPQSFVSYEVAEDTFLYTSRSEFNFSKSFVSLETSLLDDFCLYQTKFPDKKFVLIRIKYDELTLYKVYAIAV